MEDRLRQFIADSIEISEAEERQRKALAEDQQVEFEHLVSEATAARLAQTKGIPPPLLPYCTAKTRRGPWGIEDDIETLKKGAESWWPEEFFVNAPGLSSLHFSIEMEWDDGQPNRKLTGQYLIKEINVDGLRYQSWHQAIAESARIHRHKLERAQIGRDVGLQAYKAAMKEPTTAERLESLIREIAQEAILAEMGQVDPL